MTILQTDLGCLAILHSQSTLPTTPAIEFLSFLALTPPDTYQPWEILCQMTKVQLRRRNSVHINIYLKFHCLKWKGFNQMALFRIEPSGCWLKVIQETWKHLQADKGNS